MTAKKKSKRESLTTDFAKEGAAMGKAVVNASGATGKTTKAVKKPAPKKVPVGRKIPSKKSVLPRS